MKSAAAALLLAGAASAYEGYATPTTTPAPYTTINPCPGCPASIAPKPCTVTAQYQTVSTCSVYGPKGTPVCSTYPYVSTTVKDYEGKVKTITNYDDYVTIDHTKSTKTIYPKPTGGYGHYKNSTPTYEVYEKYVKVKYNKLGPIGAPDSKHYLFEDYYNKDTEETYQPVEIVECYSGKCETKAYTYTHGGKPTPSATTYEKPGTYTIPEYVLTVTKSTDECAAATYAATKGDNIYGAITTDVAYPTTFVYPYPSVKNEHGDKYVSTIIYTTIIYDHPGKYTIVPPTHTYCEGPKDIVYPTPKPVYPGEYTHTKETVTITKTNEPYTCSYQSSSTYSTPSYGTSTKPSVPGPSDYNTAPVEDYGHATAAAYGTYVKRGGVIERKRDEVKRAGEKKRVILV
jgi:hypothetical protein